MHIKKILYSGNKLISGVWIMIFFTSYISEKGAVLLLSVVSTVTTSFFISSQLWIQNMRRKQYIACTLYNNMLAGILLAVQTCSWFCYFLDLPGMMTSRILMVATHGHVPKLLLIYKCPAVKSFIVEKELDCPSNKTALRNSYTDSINSRVLSTVKQC